MGKKIIAGLLCFYIIIEALSVSIRAEVVSIDYTEMVSAACTRGEFAMLLWQAYDSEKVDAVLPYTDLNREDEYYEAVLWCYMTGKMTGLTATIFAPQVTITRAEVISIFWRLEGAPETGYREFPFEDVEPEKWYYEAICWAYGEGKLENSIYFNPENVCTIECAREFIKSFIGNTSIEDVNPPEPDKEIDLITYLAMSDAAYRDKLSQYAGQGPLGVIAGEDGEAFFEKINSKTIENKKVSLEEDRTWAQVYEQCLSAWSVAETYESLNSGLWFVIFERPDTDQVVIAFRGSESLTTDQTKPGYVDWWVDDLPMGLLNETTPQMEEAVKYVRWYIENNPEKEITVTGHSLGGGLAILAANACNIKAVAFDSAPTVDVGYYQMWDVMGSSFKGIDKWTYVDHMNQYCPIGTLEVGKKNFVKHENLLTGEQIDLTGNPASLLWAHDRFTIVDYEGQFQLSDEVGGYIYSADDSWKQVVKSALFMPLGSLFLGTSQNDTGYKVSSIPGTIHTEVIYGGDGNDTINSFQGNDYLIGGSGNDNLDGNTGNDTYIYFKGQGRDTINDYQGNDAVKLYGFDPEDVITVEHATDSLTHTIICCNGSPIIEINKNRSSNLFNSFVVQIMDSVGNISSSIKVQDWNQWKEVKTYKIACPVSVEIYDEDNNKVLTIEDNTEETIYTSFGNFYSVYNEESGEYDKMADIIDGYTIKVVGTGTGTMDIAVGETDENGEEIFYEAKDIPVVSEKIFDIDADTRRVISEEQTILLEKVEQKEEVNAVFSDVLERDWFYDAVSYVNDNGIMTGLTSEKFGPGDNLARGQLTSILHRMNGEPEVDFEPVFSDVEDGIWYTVPILWAKSAGVVNGYNDGRFGPGDMITREQMAIMMFNYAKYCGYDTDMCGDISRFKDAGSVSWYAKESVEWAVGAGIISGKTNGTIIDPQGYTARAECASIIQRFIERFIEN